MGGERRGTVRAEAGELCMKLRGGEAAPMDEGPGEGTISTVTCRSSILERLKSLFCLARAKGGLKLYSLSSEKAGFGVVVKGAKSAASLADLVMPRILELTRRWPSSALGSAV